MHAYCNFFHTWTLTASIAIAPPSLRLRDNIEARTKARSASPHGTKALFKGLRQKVSPLDSTKGPRPLDTYSAAKITAALMNLRDEEHIITAWIIRLPQLERARSMTMGPVMDYPGRVPRRSGR